MEWVKRIFRGAVLAAVFLLCTVVAYVGGWSTIWWSRASVIVDRAEAAGLLKASDAEPLTTFEKTFIVAESFPGWDERPFPCRNTAYLMRAVVGVDMPKGAPISSMVGPRLVRLINGQMRTMEWHATGFAAACVLDRRYSDAHLMRAYLADAYFGEGQDGVEAASTALYGKASAKLNVEESARLVALLRQPANYRRYPERWRERTDLIIERVRGGEAPARGWP